MQLKPLLLAAMLVASGSAFADNYTPPTIEMEGSSPLYTVASFGTFHMAGLFTDTYNFIYRGGEPGFAGVVFHSHLNNLLEHSPINFTSASMNGTPIPIRNRELTSDAYLTGVPTDGLVTLIIHGYTTSDHGSYSGALSVVTGVPEPATYGMMLGGLALLGGLAWRRRTV
ncbi:FxDxF family PEP-CTERM protein [Janthinobacterium agaricidamnosum]|uniref:PEP-CTERM putative exosortase interaction domain protein n=1 Tax=Janthinobacterium agaricidamnosum NBRC 102515 = DSM 9628 TaxID=1349767 RepID=W0V9S4_9BURK|nr:FxDxF family PEP-CTERM protein [Janthinobacterium agaricidamnosum]CDG85564.1 PEP-CTERM putative exosortase interaction domain protein [Janthinobacterium agaricidamnosum NBRC 102515 = DSM 9628]